MRALLVVCALVASTAGADPVPFVFLNETYYVATSHVPSLPPTSVLVLNGTVPHAGGAVAARCLNGTVRPYTITIGAQKDPGVMWPVSATVLPTAGGAPVSLTGRAVCEELPSPSDDGRSRRICVEFVWGETTNETLFERGGNPPPPPPQCQRAYNQKACGSASGGQCTWCTSDDGVHQLCFSKSHVPPSGWQCGPRASGCTAAVPQAGGGTDPCAGHRCDTDPCP
jgi:hypothetical protein